MPVCAAQQFLSIRQDGVDSVVYADHVIAAMVEGLGGRITWRDAPFDPELGAYAGSLHTHQD